MGLVEVASLPQHADLIKLACVLLAVKIDAQPAHLPELKKAALAAFSILPPAGELGPCAGAMWQSEAPLSPRTGPQLTCHPT